MMSILYIVTRCELLLQTINQKFPVSLVHPYTVIEWFGTSTSKNGAFPSFTDQDEYNISPVDDNHEVSSKDPKVFRQKIARVYDPTHCVASGSRNVIQKTIQNVYVKPKTFRDSQESAFYTKQRTKSFNLYLEKYTYLLARFRNSFLTAALYYKRHNNPTTLLPDQSVWTSDSNTDSVTPFCVLFPLQGTDMEGEESLLYNSQYALPNISHLVSKTQFWSKNTSEETSAISKAFDKSLIYRSQCRAMSEKTKDTCKTDLTVFTFFKAILWLTMSGGYMYRVSPQFPTPEELDKKTHVTPLTPEENTTLLGETSTMKEGRFFNRTVVPSFYTNLILMDKVMMHPHGVKRVMDFITPQKIFSQQVWRETLIYATHDQPHLRMTQPYMNWNSFENGTSFATNCYRSHLDDALKIQRTITMTPKDEPSSSTKPPLPIKTEEKEEKEGKATYDYGDPKIFTEHVSRHLIKNEHCDHLDKRVHFERAFVKMKKMNKIHAFTKEDFVHKIVSNMTTVQDKIIIQEFELRENIRDLEKVLKIFDIISTQIPSSTEEDEADGSGWYVEGSSVQDVRPQIDETTGFLTYSVIHSSARCNMSEQRQKMAKAVLENTIGKLGTEAIDIPKCCDHDPRAMTYPNMRTLLADEKSVITRDMIHHYLVLRRQTLCIFEEQSKMESEATMFIYNFAMRDHEPEPLIHKTPEELEHNLRQYLTENGLEVYSELKALYPDKMKPKSINDILGRASISAFTRLYYLLRMQQFAASIKIVPIDKSTADRIDEAMHYHRFGILDKKEVLPSTAYDVYITPCCNKIVTGVLPNSYGQRFISYNHALGTYVCNKKAKKRPTLFRYGHYLVDESAPDDENTAEMVAAAASMHRDDDDDDDEDMDIEDDCIIDNVNSKGIGGDSPKLKSSSSISSFCSVSMSSSLSSSSSSADSSASSSSEEDEEKNHPNHSLSTNNIHAWARMNHLKTLRPPHHSDLKNCDIKAKCNAAKREKNRREILPCLNAPALIINLKGKRIIHRKKGKTAEGKTSTMYGHCPCCAQFHEIDKQALMGPAGYCCQQCRKTIPENYKTHRCEHCQILIPERQHEYSIRLPMFDVHSNEKIITRKPYCNFDVPRKTDMHQYSMTNCPDMVAYMRQQSRPSTLSGSSRSKQQQQQGRNIKRVVYDTELLPTIFLDTHEGGTLKNKNMHRKNIIRTTPPPSVHSLLPIPTSTHKPTTPTITIC